MPRKNTIKKKIVKPKKNTIRKVAKHVATLSESGAVKRLLPNHSHGGPGYQPSARGPPMPDAAYLDAPQLLARFGGRSHMWLVRLLARDSSFPKPIRIGRLRFFRLADVIEWERRTAATAPPRLGWGGISLSAD